MTSSSSFTSDPEARVLLEHLAPLGDLVRESVAIPEMSAVIDVLRPIDVETLLDQAADDPEQNLPYWAEIWPSGIALATVLLTDPGLVRGQEVIELGSGVGITAAAAIDAGADLTATDYSPDSLVLTRLTCRLFAGREPGTRRVNWRSPDADLLRDDGTRWPVILAADVLYEERDIEPVLETLARIVASDGLILLAEPGRRPSKLAVERARTRGWRIETSTFDGPWPDPKDAGTVVSVHRMRRPR